MLRFTETIKDVIDDVAKGKGLPVKRISPNDDLVLKLKSNLVSKIKNLGQIPNSIIGNIVFEFREGFFEEGIRESLMFLKDIGINDDEIFEILDRVIEERYLFSALSKKDQKEKGRKQYADYFDFLVECVRTSWGETAIDKTLAYEYAKKRFLIIWDHKNEVWKATGLGNLLLDFSPVQVVTFLLTIDVVFNQGHLDRDYISLDILKTLVKQSQGESERISKFSFSRAANEFDFHTFKRLGIMKGGFYISLTPIGIKIAQDVIKEENPMIDVVNTIIQSEEQGMKFDGAISEVESMKIKLKESSIPKELKGEIKNGLDQFESKKYLSSVKTLFPAIESIANHLLDKNGENSKDYNTYRGLSNKLGKLESLGIIPIDLVSSINITYSRNKILHGEYQPKDDKYVYPIVISCIIFIKRLILEF